ncbi:MAG TPA: hypothetical protein VEV20_14270 [Burkholderiales bacterium]|nr:hypothetical protein [Burkholderiales bacterium]
MDADLLTGIAARYMGYDRKESRQRLTGRADPAIAELRRGFALSKQQAPEILDSIEKRTAELADIRNSVGHGTYPPAVRNTISVPCWSSRCL